MTHIMQRRDQEAIWTSTNPVLFEGEAGHETDTGRWKLGDGVTAWIDLPYKSGVDSVAGKTGIVTLEVADVDGAAPLASPVFTGNPTAPTPATADNDTSVATTAHVKGVIETYVIDGPLGGDSDFAATMADALALKAPLESPILTGNPTAPTPSPGDNDTSIATTAFVQALVGVGQDYTPVFTDNAGAGFSAGAGAALSGRVSLIGTRVDFWARLVLGVGFSLGGGFGLSLPFPLAAGRQLCHVALTDTGTASYVGAGFLTLASGSEPDRVTLWSTGASGVITAITNTSPFTWVPGDEIWANGSYETSP